MPDRVYDLLVIGGGINGAGIARDAALRGLSVCIVDKEDWGWATSAKSSMLAHGGLRYLEQFELGLVHEALQDRERMLCQAPHLVRPLRFIYPIYPDIAARRTVRAGLFLYDLLSHGKSVPGRDHHKKEDLLRMVPSLEPKDLKGGATYTDGQIQQVERLVQELVWDARRHGADAFNHARVVRLLVDDRPGPQDDRPRRVVTGAVVERTLPEAGQGDGDTPNEARLPPGRHTIRARAVVNAAGTWVDDVLGPLGGDAPKVRKTKGVHVVVPRFVEHALIIKARDGRTFFVIPWKDHCLIGTTDTDYPGDAGDAAADADDVRYLIESAKRYFPDAPLDDVEYTYAGVRALVNQEGLTESNVTRRHILYDHAKKEGLHGLWTLQGGKITTYRTLAEEAVDQVCRALGRDDLAHEHPTRDGTLPGGPLVPWDDFRAEAVRAARDEGLEPDCAEHLVDVHGAGWRRVLEASRAAGMTDGTARVSRSLPHVWAEVDHGVLEEQAETLSDVMLRRTDLGLAADGRPAIAKHVAKRMAELRGHDRAWIRAQLEAYAHDVRVLAVPEPTPRKRRRRAA